MSTHIVATMHLQNLMNLKQPIERTDLIVEPVKQKSCRIYTMLDAN